jgi:hypothetical protein
LAASPEVIGLTSAARKFHLDEYKNAGNSDAYGAGFGQVSDARRMVANPLADFRRWFPV